MDRGGLFEARGKLGSCLVLHVQVCPLQEKLLLESVPIQEVIGYVDSHLQEFCLDSFPVCSLVQAKL